MQPRLSPTLPTPPNSAAKTTHPRALPWLLASLLLAILIATPIAWNNGLRNEFFPKNFGTVEEGKIYRSGQISARLIEPTLQQYHIQTIIALAPTGMKPADQQAELAAAQNLHIDRELVPLAGDGTGSPANYAAAVADVDAAVKTGRPVLVHCVAGAQRTGGVIALYQLLIEHKNPHEVMTDLRRFGHDPHDNPHLLAYLNANMQQIAQILAQRGVIEKVPDPLPQLPTQ